MEEQQRVYQGRLESFKVLSGWGKDTKMVVDGRVFYQRIGAEKINPFVSSGVRVKVEYEKKATVFTDWILDRMLVASYGIPLSYDEIIAITDLETGVRVSN